MGEIITFPAVQKQQPPTRIANTSARHVHTVSFIVDEQSIVRPLQSIVLRSAHVHLEMVCSPAITLSYLYHVHTYFATHFPHITFSFASKTEEAVAPQYIIVCCVEKDR
ncbi:hypothetical protein [Caryophanon tenue]|uniref:Uncharacterized protein n=1 Tax=Caryophanon tenue TaxID=33978 RepID=A0A1C0YBT3_9BACL|nr:hypothetical protein [Caryophanon tenue]OCS84589.1 hypothetical protein A6M13_03145 [Caryophanon tenue]